MATGETYAAFVSNSHKTAVVFIPFIRKDTWWQRVVHDGIDSTVAASADRSLRTGTRTIYTHHRPYRTFVESFFFHAASSGPASAFRL